MEAARWAMGVAVLALAVGAAEEPVREHSSPALARQFHGLPHYDFSFEKVSSVFAPTNTLYLQALGQFALPMTILGLFSLLWFSLKFCCCSFHSKYKPSSVRPHRCFSVFVAILACACISVGFVGNGQVDSGAESFTQSLDDAEGYFGTVLATARATGREADLVALEVERLEYGSEELRREAVNLASDLATAADQLESATALGEQFDFAFMNTALKDGNRKRGLATSVLAGCLLAIALLFLVAVVCKSMCTVSLSLFLIIPSLWVCLIIASAEFSLLVGLSDFCADPDTFITEYVGNDVSSYFIKCDLSVVDPFGNDMASARSQLDEGFVRLRAIEGTAGAPNMTNVSTAMLGLNATLGELAADLECTVLHNDYVDAIGAICGDTLTGIAMMMFSHALTGLFYIFLCSLAGTIRNYLNPKSGYYLLMDPANVERDGAGEKAPLLRNQTGF